MNVLRIKAAARYKKKNQTKKAEYNNDSQDGNIRINLIKHAVKSLTIYKIISNEIINHKVKPKGPWIERRLVIK